MIYKMKHICKLKFKNLSNLIPVFLCHYSGAKTMSTGIFIFYLICISQTGTILSSTSRMVTVLV